MAQKTIGTNVVRDRLGEILDQARYRGNEFVVQRRGQPLAAIIPYETYEQLQRQRQQAFRVFHEIWEANPQARPEEVDRDVAHAADEVRHAKRAPRRKR